MGRIRVDRSAILPVLAICVLAVGLLTSGLPYTVQPTRAEQSAQGAQTVSRLFPETNQSVSGKFLQYWLVHGGLPQQGYPLSREMAEQSNTDGQSYTVQYFERAVFEYHPEQQPPYDVLLSQLGTFRHRSLYAGSGARRRSPSLCRFATATRGRKSQTCYSTVARY